MSDHELLVALEGSDCRYCAGTVVRGEYRGTDAVVCDSCGSPAARVF